MTIKQGGSFSPAIAVPGGSFASMDSKPAALGINSLPDLSGFVKSASGLGLLNDGKTAGLTSFLNNAAGAGALSVGKLTADAVSNCINTAVTAGVLSSSLADFNKVGNLLGTGKELGLTAGNITDRLAAIMDKAEKFGITPESFATGQTGQTDNGPLPSVGPAVTGHKLRFSPFELSEILDVRLSQGINQHATLYVKGVLAPFEQQDGTQQAQADRIIQETNAGKAAALYSLDEEGNVEVLFQGLILKVKQIQTTDLKCIEAEIISPSYLLDIKKNSRSFQRLTATYDDIIKIVTNGQAEVNNCTENKQTGKLIVQYKETDWIFLCRMASHFNTGLVPVTNSEKAQIYFGMPQGREAKAISVAAYSIQKSLDDYQTTAANDITHSKPSLNDGDFISYQVDSFDRLAVGDLVTFLEHDLYVRDINAALDQGLLKYTYNLVSKGGLIQKDRFNDNLIGVSLMGTVKIITKDQIKAHIVEIDQAYDEGTDWYFPYSTVFSSPGGSGWYCMPEPGDTVRIHFPDHREENAVASSSVNRDESLQRQQSAGNGGGSGGGGQDEEPRSNPDIKCLSNKDGKQILLTPDGIYIINQDGQTFINLTDADGITIVSAKDVSITAKENMYITAEKELLISAGKNLTLKGSDSTITMDDSSVIKIEGNQVKAN